jgi:predicted 3-demethylubiquinone-9 3-methyltransferase (glyoxalase superfamily)
MLNYLIVLCDNFSEAIYLTVVAKNKKEADKIAEKLQLEVNKPISRVRLLND